MNIDWSKAPEGTTAYVPENSNYFACWIKPGFSMRVNSQAEWVEFGGPDEEIVLKRAIQREGYVTDGERTRQEIIDLAAKRCGIAGDSIRQLATVLVAEGYRKFEIVEDDV